MQFCLEKFIVEQIDSKFSVRFWASEFKFGLRFAQARRNFEIVGFEPVKIAICSIKKMEPKPKDSKVNLLPVNLWFFYKLKKALTKILRKNKSISF
jgi:hypothetical protein